MNWNFPTRDNGEEEGYANPGLQLFKDDTIKGLAREICQNSLDAYCDESVPVKVEFMRTKVKTEEFPGISGLARILKLCRIHPANVKDNKAQNFITKALSDLDENTIDVLRISDFNTVGLQGAFDTENMTPWRSLVKSTAVSIKLDAKNAGGSYGIGKAAAFVNSSLQTVFYRTKDIDGVEAAQGVARLMAYKEENIQEPEDPVRRSTGYYGDPTNNTAVEHIAALDKIYARTEVGTDIFIPGFQLPLTGRLTWVERMVSEILENFLMSIYYGRLKIKIENWEISKETISNCIARVGAKNAKNAYSYNKVLTANPDVIVEEKRSFHGLGTLRLRVLYADDLNKNILVVRKTGMKIAEISKLPKISFTGILELQGEELNAFFRQMENPQHNKWAPDLHEDPVRAKEYKEEIESWVRDIICQKLAERTGAETDIDTGDVFNTATPEDDEGKGEMKENILDSVQDIDVAVTPMKNSFSQHHGGSGAHKMNGTVSGKGTLSGYRHRTGKRGGRPLGRRGSEDINGRDTVFGGMMATNVKARVMSLGSGLNRLVFVSENDLSNAQIEIVSRGENGKSLPLQIDSIEKGNKAIIKDGRISLVDIKAEERITVDFRVAGKQNYAMGVKVYGN